MSGGGGIVREQPVVVHGTAKDFRDGLILVQFQSMDCQGFLVGAWLRSEIVEGRPFPELPVEPGCRVRTSDKSPVAEVLAVNNGWAWLKWPSGSRETAFIAPSWRVVSGLEVRS